MLGHSRWPALNDKPSRQAACLPARISQLGSKQEKCSSELSKGGGTMEGTTVILSDFNYHIPTARMQGSPTHWFSQQEPARGKLGGKLWKSSLLVPKFMDGQAVKFRPHLKALLLFLDLLLLLFFSWGPNEFRTTRHPVGPSDACSLAWTFPCPLKMLWF